MSASEQEFGDSRPIGEVTVKAGFDLKDSQTIGFSRIQMFPNGMIEVMVCDEEAGYETRVYPSEMVRTITFPEEDEYFAGYDRISELDGTVTYWRQGNWDGE